MDASVATHRRSRPAFDAAPLLARSRLLHDMRADLRAELVRTARRISAARSEVLYGPAREAEGLYVVATGSVALVVHENDGREKVVEICGPGDCLGEDALLGDSVALTARTVAPSLLVLVPRAPLLSILERDAGLARSLLKSLSRKLARAASQIGGQSARSGQQRLIGYLLQHVGPDERGPALVTLAVPKRIVASLLGLSKETLSRLLSLLASKGMIEMKGRAIRIPNPEALAALCHSGAGCTGCAGCPRGSRWIA
ncbi:MAG: Crp/Fnr family transcriptional regulator [Clostridia bacterium]